MKPKPTNQKSRLTEAQAELNDARAYFSEVSVLCAATSEQDVCAEARDALRWELKDASAEYAYAFQVWRELAQGDVDGMAD